MRLNKSAIAMAVVAGGVWLSSAEGAIVVQNRWRLGEADSPAPVWGGPGDTTTVDSVGTKSMTKVGTPKYQASGGTSGSGFSMLFDGSSGYTVNGAVSLGSTNFGMEILVAPTVANQNACLFHDGSDGNGNGFGIWLSNGKPMLLYSNQALILAPNALPLNQWSEIAITRSNPGAGENLYVNGVLIDSRNDNSPNTPGQGITIGQTYTNTQRFRGYLDEARLFTFAPSGFSTSDLMVPSGIVPEPSSLGLLGLGGLALLRLRRGA